MWLSLVQHFQLSSVFPSIHDIWLCLTFDPCRPLPEYNYCIFLCQVFSTIWTYHYQYTLGSTASWIHAVPFGRAVKDINHIMANFRSCIAVLLYYCSLGFISLPSLLFNLLSFILLYIYIYIQFYNFLS